MRTEFIQPSDERWRATLAELSHDVYHLPEYVNVCGRQEGAAPIAFYAEEGSGRCLAPLLRRSLPGGLKAPASWSDAVSPYGYCSPLVAGGCEFARKAVQAMGQACREARIVSLFVRLHPLLPLPAGCLDSAGSCVFHGQTVYIDLTASQDDPRVQLRKDHRAGIRRLRSKGFGTVIDDWSRYGEFVRIYQAAMKRLDAGSCYRFPATYFDDLKNSLGKTLHLFSVVAPDGSVAAAGLFTERNGIVQFHLSGTEERHRSQAPSKLLVEEVKTWAYRRGNRIFHLGGGVGATEDNLFLFKAGFSHLRARFETWRVICAPEEYQRLAAMAGSASADDGLFFPQYRRAA